MRQYSLGTTWVKQNVDNLIMEQARIWLHLPPCATLNHLSLPTSAGGFNVTLPSQLYEQAQVSSRASLNFSNDNNMK